MTNISSYVEPITPFQAAIIGSPYPAQLLNKGTNPKWTPSLRTMRYAESLSTLPEFIRAVDYRLRETLGCIEVPACFDKSKVYAIIMERLTDYIESDIQLKSFIQTFEKTHLSRDPHTYIKTLRRYSSEVDEIASSQIRGFAYTGLDSDLPFSMFCDFSLSYTTYGKVFKYVIEVAEEKIGRLPMKGFRPTTIETKIDAYNRIIKPVMQEYSATNESQFKLLLYIDIANSASYEDIFKTKTLKYDAVNPETFDRYYADFRTKLLTLRRVLYGRAPKLFEENIDKNSSPAFLWATSAREALGGLRNEQ